ELEGGKEIPGGFVVARGDRPELLEFAEEILDQVALFVEFSIEFARHQAVWSRRDDGGFSSRRQPVEDAAFGIEGGVCDPQVGGHIVPQALSPAPIRPRSPGPPAIPR